MKQPHLLLIFTFLSFPFLLFSQEDTVKPLTDNQSNTLNIIYKGEHHIYIGIGLDVPMFMHFYNDKSVGTKGNGVVNATHYYSPAVGLNGFFNYKFFLDKGWALGAVLGGSYISTKQNSQTLIHLGADVTYMVRRWPVDIPISFELGGYFNSLLLPYPAENLRSGGFFMKPQIGMIYNINENWGIGFSTEWWIVPEILLNEYKNQSNFSHIWGFTINLRYKTN